MKQQWSIKVLMYEVIQGQLAAFQSKVGWTDAHSNYILLHKQKTYNHCIDEGRMMRKFKNYLIRIVKSSNKSMNLSYYVKYLLIRAWRAGEMLRLNRWSMVQCQSEMKKCCYYFSKCLVLFGIINLAPILHILMRSLNQYLTPPPKRKENEWISTVPEVMEEQEIHSNFLIKNFHGDTKYTLNYINSIYLNNGKIYNLLERSIQKKSLKCGCVKSYCEAKYCQCFRSGQACGQECNCRDCRNKKSRKNMQPYLNTGCKCRKSGCSKKYCQCFQNGKKCGSQCQCANCTNGE